MAVGKPDGVKMGFQDLHKCFHLKYTGKLDDGGEKLHFLGRNLERSGDDIHIRGQGVLRAPLESNPGANVQRGTSPSLTSHFLHT